MILKVNKDLKSALIAGKLFYDPDTTNSPDIDVTDIDVTALLEKYVWVALQFVLSGQSSKKNHLHLGSRVQILICR